MLVLTRRIGESIVIGDSLVTLKVLGVKGSHVRLGIQAEKDLSIYREEVYCREKQDAPDTVRDPETTDVG